MITNSADKIIQEIEDAKISGNYSKALNTALEGLKKHMNDYRFYEELADIHLYDQNIEKAEEAIRYARELHPNSGTGLYLEGYIFMEKGDFENAITVFEKSNKIFPNNAEVIKNIGWCYVMLGNMQKGILMLRRAQTLSPDDIEIQQYLNTAILLNKENNN